MGDVPTPLLEPEDEAKLDALQPHVRRAITGSDEGSLRRPVLFIIAAASMVLATISPFMAVPGLMALILLALTDQVVEL